MRGNLQGSTATDIATNYSLVLRVDYSAAVLRS